MKYIALLLFVSLAILSLNSCKKKTDAAPVVTSTMSYKVDGIAKTALNAGTTPGGASFGIFGEDAEGSVSIIIHNKRDSVTGYPIKTDLKVGSYNLDNSLLEMWFSANPPQSDAFYFGYEGTLKITAVTDDRIKGNFEFTAADTSGRFTKTITDGVFDCKIQKR